MSGFGGSGNSGGSLFGNFGQNNSNSSSQPLNLFGNTTTTSAPSTSTNSLFGGTSSGATTSANNLFGAASSNTGSSGPFGTTAQSSSSNQLGASTGTPTGALTFNNNISNEGARKEGINSFINLATPNKQSDATSQSPASGVFGQAATSTPANKLSGMNNNSTTPAGPPPANAQANLFGGSNNSKPGGLFGSANTTGESNAANKTTSGGLFGSSTQNNSNNLFSKPNSQPSGGNIFQNTSTQNSNQSKPVAESSAASQPGQFTSSGDNSSISKPGLSFPSLGTTSSASQPSSSAANASSAPPASGNLFTNPAASKNTNSSNDSAQNLFAGAGQSSSASTTQTTGLSLFQAASSAPSNINISTNAQSTETSKPNPSTAPTSTAAPLFGASTPAASSAPQGFGTTTQATSNDSHTNTTTSGAAGGTGASVTSGLGASTVGQPPSAQSRLKNKSMDDVITRWASDLTKYQKEFQSQADKIAGWDRQLVENSNAVTKLYSRTYQAERDTAEIQKQLAAVESHQDELAHWLDRYEQEVDDLMSRQISQKDGLQGPDQERERTYKSADAVAERLGEMNQDLTSMIEEINSASSNISRTNRADDPVSRTRICRVYIY